MRSLATALVFVLSSCVALSETECGTGNWYALGERDGLSYGLQPLIDQYAARCSAYGVTVDSGAYMAGWAAGYAEWTRRLMVPEGPN